MAIKSDDSDIEKTWFRTLLGGNGDYYLQVVFEDENGVKKSKGVRVSTSGGYTKDSDVKVAVANLFRAMEKAGLNDFVDYNE
jgi:hypothetical protein